ncbi:PREDICTED: uncharacterized protein LOC18597787 isoform X2 [Theobroma cacao]|uniref:Uncharacterized protein LOC18597787 isoform X2 n=1 Tax=Theobroma cacao TaxID=3641 RepID=A0AB32V1V9_THECC|nr:PREDICTED: uncharacterized protein LOC18597787 isoform X2 [Theobroma cacao]
MAPKTRSQKDYNGAQNDSKDGGSSYFQKTVSLHDWWLVKADKDFEGKRLAVAGSTSRELEAVRLFTSAPIVKRYDVFTLETADGICVCIKGFINRHRTEENGFSSEVFTHFSFGFPPYWEEYAKKCLGENGTTDIELEVVRNPSKPARDSDPSLILTPIEHVEVASQDKHVQMSCFQTASKGSDVLNPAVNLSSKVEKRSNLNIGVAIDCSHNLSEQIAAAVDASNASNTQDPAAKLLTSVEERINHSPSNIETDNVNVRKKKNRANISPYISGNRRTRSQIIKGSPNESSGVGCSMTPKERASATELQDEQKLSRRITRSFPSMLSHVNERCSSGKETRRKLDFEKVASPVSRERKGKQSVISPESLSLKCSRSGRLLLPRLEFWRNQIAVYDQTRKITGIREEADVVKPSGSRSEPQKRQKRLSRVS